MLEPKFYSGIDLAIASAGNQAGLAAALGVSQQAVSCWAQQGWVPLRRATQIEGKFAIPRHRLVNPTIVSLLLQAPPT
jgi:DNA-binding transcriptional regulator YdaS (Cro superfamily)